MVFESVVAYFGDDFYAELVVFYAERLCFCGTICVLRMWALVVAAFVGEACDVEDTFEREDVFAPFDVASFEGGAAVWAKAYFRLEVYWYCLAVVFRYFHD